MRIQHNIMAMNAYRNYNNNTSALSSNLEKLSSGYKINRAGDDAAGLAISEKMRAQISGLDQAQSNVKDGISLVKTGEGALQEVQDMLNRMVTLATQSANGTYDDSVDRANLQKEVDSLKSEINRIAESSNFNGINLLDGSLGLNTDAFDFDTALAKDAEVQSLDISATGNGTLPASTVTMTPASTAQLHLGTAGSVQKAPTFTVDLTGFSVTNTSSQSAGSFAVTIAGKALANVAISTGATLSGSALAQAIAAVVTTNTTFDLGGMSFLASAVGSTIKFTAVAMTTGTKFSTDAQAITTAAAKAVNTAMVGAIKITASTKTTVDGSNRDHNIIDVNDAVAYTTKGLAGIDLDFSKGIVANGNTLTIDDKTFVFQTDKNNPVTASDGQILIDVSALTVAADQQAEAIRQISQTTDGKNFHFEAKDATHLHVDQLSTSDKTYAKYQDLADVFSASKITSAAQNAGATIKVNASKISEGNTIKVDGVSYVFSKDAAKKTDTDDTKYVALDGSEVTNLQNALTKAGYDVSLDQTTLTVRSKTSGAAAPEVSGKGLTLQIGDTSDDFNQLAVTIKDMHTTTMGIDDIDISTQDGASTAINKIKDAINFVSSTRGTLGATQNRLEHTANNLSVMAENIQDAESTIRDTDIAEEMMSYTKNSILVQSAQAMLAQANTVPQGVLQLLQ